MPLHTSTILARAPDSILSYVSQLSKKYSGHNILFTLSHNANGPDLSRMVQRLLAMSPSAVGCLSASVPYPPSENLISCSFAVFSSLDSVLFRSTIPGKASTQVGRWHSFRKKNETPLATPGNLPDGSVNWEDVWARKAKISSVPSELRHLEADDIKSLIYLSDNAWEGLANALAPLPATQLGLIASSTPFVTGRPMTLFHNQNIFSSGAVGIALTGKRSAQLVGFQGLTPLTQSTPITKSEGNLVIEINGENPTQLLLSAIKKNGLNVESNGSFKDDEDFYIGAVFNDVVNRVYRITAGDPSRGTVSVDSDLAPVKGTMVQFFHRPKALELTIPDTYQRSHCHHGIAFMVSSEPVHPSSGSLAMQAGANSEETHVLQSTFLSASENGFILAQSGKGSEVPWRCTVPGGHAGLEWRTS